MTYAGIKGGVVRELFTPLPSWAHIEPSQIFHPDLFDAWVPIDQVDPKPQSGWTYDGQAFAPPPPIEDVAARRAWAAKVGLHE